MTAFRWAVLGPGRIARRFAQAGRALTDARLAVVIGRDEGRAREFADEHCEPGITRVGTDLSELLRKRDADAVYIATPHAFHAEEAAKRGLLREYTAWAVAVGEVDRWQKAVSHASIAPNTSGLGYVYMAPLLLSSTSHASTPRACDMTKG